MNGSSYHEVPEPPAQRRTVTAERVSVDVAPVEDLTITAALSWWDESADMLQRAVRASAHIADRIVALDGAYRRFPGGTPASPPEQAEAIREAAAAVGLDCLVLAPDRLWSGEEEKRTYLYQLAAIGSDWIAVVDADHIIACEREVTRSTIASRSDVDVWSVDLYTRPNEARAMGESAAGPWHAQSAGIVIPFAHLLRALPDIRVERFHWWHSALLGTERVWMQYGGNDYAVPDGRRVLPHVHLDGYRVDHETLYHDADRVRANRAFYDDRAVIVGRTESEDDWP